MPVDNIKIFIGRNPRCVVLSSNGYNLLFQRYYNKDTFLKNSNKKYDGSVQFLNEKTPTVILKQISNEELSNQVQYVELNNQTYDGFLGLITIHGSIYIILISHSQKIGFPRWTETKERKVVPSENIYKILDVDFFSLETTVFDSYYFAVNETNEEKLLNEHPCGSLKKLFRSGTFYFSKEFDISTSVRNHGLVHNLEYIINNCDNNFIWNANLINEIVTWRNRLPYIEKKAFDDSKILTFIIRGFCKTLLLENDSTTYLKNNITKYNGNNTEGTVMATSADTNGSNNYANNKISLTIISRISIENKENCLSNDCLTEDGKVSNFIETEVVTTTKEFIFSYTLVSGNIPLFWEMAEGQLLYNKKKVKLIKDPDSTQPAFNTHFDSLESKYGVVSIINLIKPKSDSQELLANVLQKCAEMKSLKITNLESHCSFLLKNPNKLLYLLNEDIYEFGSFAYDREKGIYFGKQTGVLRISAFDSIQKPIKIAMIISREIIELTTREIDSFDITSVFFDYHDRLWEENCSDLERLHLKNSSKYKRLYSKLFNSSIRLYDPLHFYISHYLRQLKTKFTYERDSSIFCGTFNVSGKLPSDVDLKQWLIPNGSTMANIYIVGLEEVIELTPGHMLLIDPFVKSYWEKKILKELNDNDIGCRYTKRWSNQLGGVLLMFFVEEKEYPEIKNIEGDVKKTGFGGIASNKGAVALSFKYSATTFCIVVSHLAAGLENVSQRHNDYKTIFKNIRFTKGAKIKDHDAIVWMGDFNYRILMSNEEVRQLILEKEFSKLFQNDQLNQQMIVGESFPYFHEMPINFAPTYKFDPGTKTYDTSEKMRIPAWTDRILSRGEVLRQTDYGSAEDILFSDHRPVYATFQAHITVVDEQKKADLSNKIYERLKQKLAILDDDEKVKFLSDKAVSILESRLHPSNTNQKMSITHIKDKKNTKLPPPSSELKKWWVNNGQSVKITLDIDPKKVMINRKKSSNPFAPDDGEPFFVPR